jgi:uncharacterized protein
VVSDNAMGRIHLRAEDRLLCYDEALGRFTDGEEIPCFRCGVCCERWQPLIGPLESARLAALLGLPLAVFLDRFARPYPFAEATYQLLERPQGGCVFLESVAGRSGCGVHEARPQACRDWDASLLRRECRDGLNRLGDDAFAPIVLYDDPADAACFVERLRSPLPMGARGG